MLAGMTRAEPRWWLYLLLPLLHFASVKLTFLCAVSPENEVVVWLPNAVLLAALLYFRGRRGWLMATLTFGSDLLANLPVFPAPQAFLLSAVNLAEVTVTYLLLRRTGTSPALERIADLGKFVVIGPLLGALLSGLLAGLVLRTLPGVSAPYPTLVLLWWFGDGLGLLIYTPLLLALAQPTRDPVVVRWQDVAVVLVTGALAALILSGHAERWGGVPLTPNLLLPSVLFMAVRFGARWTALAVALISLATAWAQTTGHKPFGDAPPHELILRTQEFILTLSIVGMGFATLFSEQRALTRSLEDKVRERTQKLEESNSKLGALSATDGLTGIANRRRFDEFIANEWRHAKVSGQPVALALLDVDLFKSYNDHYGHQAGDDCLRTIAQVLSANVRRAGDLVARYGGEEFALVAVAADEANALAMAQHICKALQALGHPHALSPFGVVTASIGVAVLVPAGDDSHEALIRAADQALYQAKARGRNQAVLARGAPSAA
jgi:diguanylate cyclase (GGDEF)-like protein